VKVYFFDLDYSGYVIEHFPHMEHENSELAERFAYTVDQAYELGTSLGLSDEEFRMEIANAFNEWLGEKRLNLI
jgi:predicted ATPase